MKMKQSDPRSEYIAATGGSGFADRFTITTRMIVNINSLFRRPANAAIAALVALVLAACADMLVEPAPAPSGALGISYRLDPRFDQVPASSDGSGAAFDAADAAWVRVTAGQVLVDTVLPFTPAGEARLSVDIPLGQAVSGATVELELRAGGDALFTGVTQVSLEPGDTATAEIALMPRPASVVAPDSARFNALGDTLDLMAAAVFATGDTIADVPVVWSTADPDLVQVTATGLVISIGNGNARVIASAGSTGGVADTVTVRVRQVAAQLTLLSDTVPMGDTAPLSISASDSNGVAIGIADLVDLTLSSPNNGIAEVNGTNVVGAMIGMTTVTLVSGSIADTASILVSPAIEGSAAVGRAHSCVLDVNSRVYCWGDNAFGQLGNGSAGHESVPVAAATVPPLFMISAAGNAVCGIDADREGNCWGANNFGQLGNGTTTASGSPVAVSGNLGFASISVGERHACGLTTAGIAYCWGYNRQGQLGATTSELCGTQPCSTTPVQVSGGFTFTELAAGGFHTCGLTADGAAYCWGWNGWGGLGDGTTTDSNTPVAVAGGLRFASIQPVVISTCGIATDGQTYCWGSNTFGQLGNGTTESSLVPTLAAAGFSFTSLATTRENIIFESVCGITADGSAYCWGSNNRRQLGGAATSATCGSGFLAISCSTAPVAVTGGFDFETIEMGLAHACGIAAGGDVHCWGSKGVGGLGNGTIGASLVPSQVAGGVTFDVVSAGEYWHTCAVAQNGSAHCWGHNATGQLGDGTANSSAVPVAVSGGLGFQTVDAGGTFTCGRTVANNAYCWGANNYGQLGDGTTNPSNAPVAVSGGLTVRSMSSTFSYTDLIDDAGNFYWWGQAQETPVNNTPQFSGDTRDFRMASAAASHGCFVTTASEAFCRGHNTYGQLGDGTTTDGYMVPVAGGIAFSSVTAGRFHTCGLATDGTAHCWGRGDLGQLGQGSTTNSTVPVAVAGGITFTRLSAGTFHTCGVDSSGSAYCWGSNLNGQLGNGSTASVNTPTPVTGGITFASISAGEVHTCGVAQTGAAYCWGAQGDGMLGDGSVEYVTGPVMVSASLPIFTALTPSFTGRPSMSVMRAAPRGPGPRPGALRARGDAIAPPCRDSAKLVCDL
jgi:alpha-tubulin suppressor-like RCC1 family protein